MKRTAISLSILLLAAAPAVALADSHPHNMNQADMHRGAQGQMEHMGHMGQGTVNTIDMQNMKVNMTHGPIQSLGWPGMTMDFKVKDAAVLHGIKPGQKVSFELVKEGPKQYFVTRITPQQ